MSKGREKKQPEETNYRVAYRKFWDDVKAKDPQEIINNRQVTYDEDSLQYTVSYFREEYCVDCRKETITRVKDGAIPDMMDGIIILNYLAYAEPLEEKPSQWVSLKEIPGCMIFYPAFHKTSILALIETFGNDASLLVEVAPKLSGEIEKFGDACAVFDAFPEIPLCAVVWEGDEEVPSNATILFEPSIAHMLHGESIIGLGMQLASKLKKLARQAKGATEIS